MHLHSLRLFINLQITYLLFVIALKNDKSCYYCTAYGNDFMCCLFRPIQSDANTLYVLV